jgi:membrane-anchored mycosin MYCP
MAARWPQAEPVRGILGGLVALTTAAMLLTNSNTTAAAPANDGAATLVQASAISGLSALTAVARRVDAPCPQTVRQQAVATPTGPTWNAVRLGVDHVAGLSLGAGQVVAVIDTGVAAVPAPAGAVRPAIDLVVPDGTLPAEPAVGEPAPAQSNARADQPASVADCDGRGTVLAGLTAARRGAGEVLPGFARAAEILPVRVTASSSDLPEPQVLAGAIDAAVAGRATVVLVAGAVRDDQVLQTAVQDALAAAIPVVAAAGDGTDRALAFPAS